MSKQKKYSVSYNSAPNACGVEREKRLDTITEVDDFLNGVQNSIYSKVRVFDNELNDFVYWKDCFEKPYIDLLTPKSHFRDLRTKDRKAHR